MLWISIPSPSRPLKTLTRESCWLKESESSFFYSIPAKKGMFIVSLRIDKVGLESKTFKNTSKLKQPSQNYIWRQNFDPSGVISERKPFARARFRISDSVTFSLCAKISRVLGYLCRGPFQKSAKDGVQPGGPDQCGSTPVVRRYTNFGPLFGDKQLNWQLYHGSRRVIS